MGWTATEGTGHGAMGAGSVGGMAVTLEKMWESAFMAENLSSPRVANGVGVGCNRASLSVRAEVVAALVELLNGTGQS